MTRLHNADKKWKLWLSFVAICFLNACAGRTELVALGPSYQSRPLSNSEARVVVLWPTDQSFGSGVIPRVLINGIDIGKLEPLGYADAIVSPGQVTIAVRSEYVDRDGNLTKSAGNLVIFGKPGSEIFVEYSVAFGLLAPTLSLKELPVSVGLEKAKLVRKTVNN